jgi:D-alanyl-D-alanine carboxypeptidase
MLKIIPRPHQCSLITTSTTVREMRLALGQILRRLIFVRAYVRGDLFDLQTRSKQRKVFEGGGSEPPGPGKNSAGLGVYRYETSCGPVWGHTGNIPGGYTQFMAASPTGSRSATLSINSQLTLHAGDPDAFKALRRAEDLAVCAALAGK